MLKNILCQYSYKKAWMVEFEEGKSFILLAIYLCYMVI